MPYLAKTITATSYKLLFKAHISNTAWYRGPPGGRLRQVLLYLYIRKKTQNYQIQIKHNDAISIDLQKPGGADNAVCQKSRGWRSIPSESLVYFPNYLSRFQGLFDFPEHKGFHETKHTNL